LQYNIPVVESVHQQ